MVKEIANTMQLPKEIGCEGLITWKNIKAYGLLEGHLYKSVNLQHKAQITSNENGYNMGRKNLKIKLSWNVMLSCQLSISCVLCFKGSQGFHILGQAVHKE